MLIISSCMNAFKVSICEGQINLIVKLKLLFIELATSGAFELSPFMQGLVSLLAAE